MPHKYRLFVGGYGSGKTWVGCMAQCIHFLEHPGVDQGYFAPIYSHIKDIYYPTIEEVAHSFGLKIRVNEQHKQVFVTRGKKYYGMVRCKSMDNPASIVGFKIGHALVDELDTLPIDKAKLAWTKIIARLRYKQDGVKNGVDVTTTPEGFRYVYQQWVQEVQAKPELAKLYGLIQASTYDNAANLNWDYIESLVATYSDELKQAYLNGQFVNLTSGTVFNAYNRKTHRSTEKIKPKEPLRIGMDFNVGKMAAVVYVMRGKQWHAVEELHAIFDTPAMIDAIKEKYPEHNIRIYPDASGKARKTVGASESDISLLSAAGFVVYAETKNPLIKDRVLSTNVAFEKGLLYINDIMCPEYARCMEQLPYDKNGQPDKTMNLDHITDAGTYPVAHDMPIVKPPVNLRVKFAR